MSRREVSVGTEMTENSYLIDIESGMETARLLAQESLLARALGGLFPEQPDLSQVKRILDLGCGPGAWANEVAFAYPDIEVVGVDLSATMVEYARAMARVQRRENASFQVMDVRQPLAFEDQSFDLVHGRFLASFLAQRDWPHLIAECKRVLTTGGILRLSECEVSISSSLALQRLHAALYQALYRQGRTFSHDGCSIGIAHMLGKFLRDAGFEQIEQYPFLLDCSLGLDMHASACKQTEVSFLLLKPYLITTGVIGEAEFDALHHRMMIEMLHDDFTCLSFGLIVRGKTSDRS